MAAVRLRLVWTQPAATTPHAIATSKAAFAMTLEE
jgi:hypothetical protein